MELNFFFVWKLFKLSLTCNGGDGGSGGSDSSGDSSSNDGGFSGDDDGFGNDNSISQNSIDNDIDNSLGFGDNTCGYSSIDGIDNAFGSTNSSLSNNGNNGSGDTSNGWNSPTSPRSINTNINPPTVTTFDSNMNVVSVTTNTISTTSNGYEITSNKVTTGYLDDNFDSITVSRYSQNGQTISITGGTIASHLADLGLSGEEAIAGEAIGKAVVSSLLGVGTIGLTLTSLSAVTQVLGVTGVLSQAEYNDATMAIGIAGAMIGAYHTMQTISAITSVFGYMNATQKVLAITISALSIKNTINSFQSISEKYNIEPSDINIANIADIDFNENDSILEHYEKIVKYTKEQQLSYGTNPSNWQLIDKMAGSYLFDCFLAGSDLFNAIIKPTQVMGCVGSNYNIPIFAKQSYLQENFLLTIDDFNKISNIYERDNNIMFSIKI